MQPYNFWDRVYRKVLQGMSPFVTINDKKTKCMAIVVNIYVLVNGRLNES